MSQKPTKAEIQAETRRRKRIWQRLQADANKAFNAVKKEAKRRGITAHDKWLLHTSPNYAVLPYRGGLAKFTPRGKLTPFDPRPDTVYGGYPDVSDDAPGKTTSDMTEVLLVKLDGYCDYLAWRARNRS